MQLVRIAEITGKTPIEICWQVQTVVVRSNSYVVMYMVFKQGFCKTTKKIRDVFSNFSVISQYLLTKYSYKRSSVRPGQTRDRYLKANILF